MKKTALLSITLLLSCINGHSLIADNQVVSNAEVTEFEQLDEATQARMIKAATFVNLIQKANAGEISIDGVVYFALEWAKELEKSDDPADQELCAQLYQTVRNFRAALKEEEKELQENQ